MNTDDLKKQIISEVLGVLGRFDKIPLEVELALKRKLGLRDVTSLSVSSKTAASETQAVDEGGSGTYNVMRAPDGFLSVEINGVIYQIPYFS